MISSMQAEKLRLLGYVPPSEQKETPSQSDTGGEPSGLQRLNNPKAFLGNHCALEVLPPLGLTFDDIQGSCTRTGLPALDVGMSQSSVAAEGALRDIPIHSTELPPIRDRGALIQGVEWRLNQLRGCYESPDSFPEEFGCAPIEQYKWEATVRNVLQLVASTLSECSASNICKPDGVRASDQSYSIVFSHHGVPKYCSTESFLSAELPELLRVTADRLHLFPFRSAGPGNELLHVAGSPEYQRICGIAKKAGFSFKLFPADHIVPDPNTQKPEPGFDMTGVFVRDGGYTRFPKD